MEKGGGEVMNFDDFKRERDDALRSHDAKKIRAYVKKYGVPMPTNPIAWWAAIHKARMSLTTLSDDEREISKQWLLAQGMTPALRLPKAAGK